MLAGTFTPDLQTPSCGAEGFILATIGLKHPPFPSGKKRPSTGLEPRSRTLDVWQNLFPHARPFLPATYLVPRLKEPGDSQSVCSELSWVQVLVPKDPPE